MTVEGVRTSLARAYERSDATAWDQLVERSVNGTILHTRRFLSYHGDRFRDRSLMITNEQGRVAGLFPAAEHPADPAAVSSHPGLTYGGLIHDGSLAGAAMIQAFEDIASEYRSLGFSRLLYKAVPHIYQSAPASDDLYSLFRLGAVRRGCDLAAVIDLSRRGKVRADRRRSRKRAEALGVRTEEGWGQAADFWQILEMNLAQRHGAAPTHSLAEIDYLHATFPFQIVLILAKMAGTLLGGCMYIHAGPVLHQQYTAATDEGRTLHATDLAIERAISIACERGCRYVSFGTSTLGQGAELNESQYDFKTSFGAGGVTHDHYQLAL